MATWRVAKSLDQLLAQLNTYAPKRSKLSDGSIGDAAHASRDSDHNPWVKLGAMGIVTARDFSNDPAGGLACEDLAKWLVTSNDPRIKYLIWNKRIWTPGIGWRPYSGINDHTHHLHLSVRDTPDRYDSTTVWAVAKSITGGAAPTAEPDAPAPTPTPPVVEDEDMAATFVTADGSSPWFLTDGFKRRLMAPGEPDLMVAAGLAKWHGEGKVAVIGPDFLARIPVQN